MNFNKVPLFFWFDLSLEARAEILRSYFGRNDDFINLFWDLLTFRYVIPPKIHRSECFKDVVFTKDHFALSWVITFAHQFYVGLFLVDVSLPKTRGPVLALVLVYNSHHKNYQQFFGFESLKYKNIQVFQCQDSWFLLLYLHFLFIDFNFTTFPTLALVGTTEHIGTWGFVPTMLWR